MSNSLILIADDDSDIAFLLEMYLRHLGFKIDVTIRGSDVINKAKRLLPDLIILDIMLPDIDGYEICQTLRANNRTNHIPIIFLTQKDERSDMFQGLELGAYDYCTKPFDVELLKLRIQGAIMHTEREILIDPHSRLPTGSLIDKHLRRTGQKQGWALLNMYIKDFEPFRNVYGAVAGNDVLSFTSTLFGEVLDEIGSASDFIGHVSDNHFIITTDQNALLIKQQIQERFDLGIQTYYSFLDRQQGFICTLDEKEYDLMRLTVNIIHSEQTQFSNPRDLLRVASEDILSNE